MTLYYDPDALTPDAEAPRALDAEDVARWLAAGRTHAWMCEESERRYNAPVSPASWHDVRQRPARDAAAIRNALVPWVIRPEHRWAYALTMLRSEARRRAGGEVTERDGDRLDLWIENLRLGDLVIHYEPRSDEGFRHVPRRRGVDTDLIREPGR